MKVLECLKLMVCYYLSKIIKVVFGVRPAIPVVCTIEEFFQDISMSLKILEKIFFREV